MKNKIKLAVSSCLLGEAVRYDGTDKHVHSITDLEQDYVLVSLCPEMAVGMGVPRPPIQLVKKEGGIEVRGVEDPAVNMTKPLTKYAEDVLNMHIDVCGYVFKKNSPSCGTKNVKVFNEDGEYEASGQGIYAARIMQALPGLPVIDEEDFQIVALRKRFLEQVTNYYLKPR